MKHTEQRPEKIRDPYLGPRWVLVGCELCGAKGRYKFLSNARIAAQRHNEQSHDGEVTR